MGVEQKKLILNYMMLDGLLDLKLKIHNDPTSMQEKHEFGLVIARNSVEAKNIAKSKWLIGYKKSIKMILLL